MSALATFDALETPLKPVLDPRVFVESKDKGKASETTRQAEWVNHMHKHARGVLVFAIPNGTNIPSLAGRAKIKKEGLYTGFPDTGAVWGSGTAYLEWKDADGALRDAQIECLNKLVAMGYPCAVVRTAEAASRWLHEHCQAPVPLIRKS